MSKKGDSSLLYTLCAEKEVKHWLCKMSSFKIKQNKKVLWDSGRKEELSLMKWKEELCSMKWKEELYCVVWDEKKSCVVWDEKKSCTLYYEMKRRVVWDHWYLQRRGATAGYCCIHWVREALRRGLVSPRVCAKCCEPHGKFLNSKNQTCRISMKSDDSW